MPFILGTQLARAYSGTFDTAIFILGISAVVLIMLSTYHAGEYYDFREDALSKAAFKSKFSGGSGVIQAGLLSRDVALLTSVVSFTLAALIGIVLQFFIQTGPYTILLGVAGALPGFFYSTKPVRLVARGIGELFIGFCYGWLPVAVAFYIQTGFIHPICHWVSIPIGLTIFNVILLNEFPDYPSDEATGKRNLLVRVGQKKGIVIYAAASISAWFSLYLSVNAGVPISAFYLFLVFVPINGYIVIRLAGKAYENIKTLEMLCGLNIAVNLGCTASFIFAFI